jgi:hypothetical protein
MRNIIWNTSEEERFENILKLYVKDKQCLFLSYDIAKDCKDKKGFEWDFNLERLK